MHILTWIGLGFLILLIAWILGLRRWLKSKAFAQGFFAKIEPIEIALWKKSESILWARFQSLLGILAAILPLIGAFDVSPFMVFIPEHHRWWVPSVPGVAVSLNGIISELLRRSVTQPVAITALPDQVPAKVALAVAEADIAKDNAVIAVEQAKEEKKI